MPPRGVKLPGGKGTKITDLDGVSKAQTAAGQRLTEVGSTAETLVADLAPVVTDALYAKGQKLVRCPKDGTGMKTRAMRLAGALRGRWTHRERGYVMSPRKAERLLKLFAEGWDASFPNRRTASSGGCRAPSRHPDNVLCGLPQYGQMKPILRSAFTEAASVDQQRPQAQRPSCPAGRMHRHPAIEQPRQALKHGSQPNRLMNFLRSLGVTSRERVRPWQRW